MTWIFGGLYLALWLVLKFIPASFWAGLAQTWFVWQQHWRPKPLASEEILTALRAAQGGQRPFLANLPEYKFYTALWRQMDQLARLYGTPLRAFWQDLRAAITKDRQFEYQLKRERINAYVQFVVIGGVTWAFVGFPGIYGRGQIIRFGW